MSSVKSKSNAEKRAKAKAEEISRIRLIQRMVLKTTPLTDAEVDTLNRLILKQNNMAATINRRLIQEPYIREQYKAKMKQRSIELRQIRERERTKRDRERRINEKRKKEEEFNSNVAKQVEMMQQLEADRRKRLDDEITKFFAEMDQRRELEENQITSNFLV